MQEDTTDDLQTVGLVLYNILEVSCYIQIMTFREWINCIKLIKILETGRGKSAGKEESGGSV